MQRPITQKKKKRKKRNRKCSELKVWTTLEVPPYGYPSTLDFKKRFVEPFTLQIETFTLAVEQTPKLPKLEDSFVTGGTVWDAAVICTNYLATQRKKIENSIIVELGSGTGICGICCAKLGASKVYLTDLESNINLLEKNINLNQISNKNIEILAFNWREYLPVNTFPSSIDFILASDLIYHECIVEPLMSTICEMFDKYPEATMIWSQEKHHADLWFQFIQDLQNFKFSVEFQHPPVSLEKVDIVLVKRTSQTCFPRVVK